MLRSFCAFEKRRKLQKGPKAVVLTRGGLFINGRDLLFSADRETIPARLEEVDGAKAEADPARKAAARAASFTIFKTSRLV